MYSYVTVDQIKNIMGLNTTTDDALLADLVAWATAVIDSYKERRFDVRYETRVFDTPYASSSSFGSLDGSYALSSKMPPLRLDADLLAVDSLTNGDGEDFLPGEYVLEPANITPKNRIRLRSGSAWLVSEDGAEQAISVAGWWGYHDRYGDAWKGSELLGEELSASADEIPLAAFGNIQAGHLVRLDDELMHVLEVTAVVEDEVTSYSVSVERAFNGSSAALHASGVQIEIFHPMGTIEKAAHRLVKWFYSQRDVDNFDRSYILGSGVVNVPTNLPSDVISLLGARGRATL